MLKQFGTVREKKLIVPNEIPLPANVFAAQVTGDCMSPLICAGDTVLCDPRAPFVPGLPYCVVDRRKPDDFRMIKLAYMWDARNYELVPANRAEKYRIIAPRSAVRLARVLYVYRPIETTMKIGPLPNRFGERENQHWPV